MKNRSYRKRVKFLYGGSIAFLLLYIIYFTNTTWPLYSEKCDLESKVLRASSAPQDMARLKKELSLMEQTIGARFADTVTGRELLLAEVSHFCGKKNLTLREFPMVSFQNEKGMELETNVVVAEGKYHELLELLYFLEVEENLGRPVSVSFVREYDRKIKKEILTMTIYLQTIRWKKT